MIKIGEVTDRYRVKAEKDGVTDGIASDNYRISLLYNEAQNKFMTLHLQNRGIDDVRYIQNFLVLDKKLSYSSKSLLKADFKLPQDCFDISGAKVVAKKEYCTAELDLTEVRTENLTEKLQDEYTKPSFEWREAIYTVNSNNLSIYTDKTFEISEAILDYYRYPSQLKLKDETDPESEFSEDSLIEWDPKSLDDIITLMVFSSDINENNPRYQLQTLRIQK